MYFEFVPFRDSSLLRVLSLKRNQVLLYHPTVSYAVGCAPTEVLFTPRAFFLLFPLARLYSQKNHPCQVASAKMSLLHSALVQVPGAGHLEGIKNPEGRRGTSGLRLGTNDVP